MSYAQGGFSFLMQGSSLLAKALRATTCGILAACLTLTACGDDDDGTPDPITDSEPYPPGGSTPDGSGSTQDPSDPEGDTSSLRSEYGEHYKIVQVSPQDKALKKMDVLWAVDNSKSMTYHRLATLTGNNVRRFVNLYASDDVKVGVISYSDTRSSHASNCVASGTHASSRKGIHDWKLKIKHKDHVTSINCKIDAFSHVPALSAFIEKGGALGGVTSESFFRENTFKAFVVVSDHSALAQDATTFIKKARERFQSSHVAFYSFASSGAGADLTFSSRRGNLFPTAQIVPGYSSNSPCGSYYDTIFTDISRALTGIRFSMCQKDWSQSFNQLMHHTKLRQKSVLSLDMLEEDALIASVLIGDTHLPSSAYSILPGNPLTLWIKEIQFLDGDGAITLLIPK